MSGLERLTLTNVKEWLRAKAMEASLEQASNFAWLHMKATEAGYHLSNALSRPIGDPPSVAFGGVPVVMLGCSYVPALTSGNLHEREARLVHDLRSRVWLTYRSNFPPISGTNHTTDAGWGCMLRCGQMILAQTLLALLAGRGWRSDAVPAWAPQLATDCETAPPHHDGGAADTAAATAATGKGDAVARTAGASRKAAASAAAAAAAAAAATAAGAAAAGAAVGAAARVGGGGDGKGGGGGGGVTAPDSASGASSAPITAPWSEAALLALFADTPDAPFSVHRIALEGGVLGTPAGGWHAPTTICQVLAVLVHHAVDAAVKLRVAEPFGAAVNVNVAEPFGAAVNVNVAEPFGAAAEPAALRSTNPVTSPVTTTGPAINPAEATTAHTDGDEPAEADAEGGGHPKAVPQAAEAESPSGECDDTSLEAQLLEATLREAQQLLALEAEAAAAKEAAAAAVAAVLPELSVHVAMDGTLYRQHVEEAAGRGGGGSWRPVLIFIPLRLGLESLNPQYAPALARLFGLPQSVGMIGGRPRAAHYFVGSTSAGKLLYLDPHTVQPALRREAPEVRSCHYTAPTVPSIRTLELDPSLALGFLCRSHADLDRLCTDCEALFATCLPPFSLAHAPPNFDLVGEGGAGADEGEGGGEDDEDMVLL